MVTRLLLLSLCVAISGCATVGPRIDREELEYAHAYYEVKAKRHAYRQWVRVRTVGERLLRGIPQEHHSKKPQLSVGILLDRLDLTSGRAFAIPGVSETIEVQKEAEPPALKWKSKKSSETRREAALIIGVIAESPAARAGIQAGDLLLKVGKRKTSSPRKAAAALKKLKPGATATLLLEREGVQLTRKVLLEEKPYLARFNVIDKAEVNARAEPGLRILVTSGLLRFVNSDDELAVVLAHELAHLTEGHVVKGIGTNIFAGLIGIAAGVAVDVVIPGAGGVISRVTTAGIRAPFSRDFEREADYVGLQYVHRAGYKLEAGIQFWDRFATELTKSLSRSFFNTHPTSPERLLRLKKAIQEIEKTS